MARNSNSEETNLPLINPAMLGGMNIQDPMVKELLEIQLEEYREARERRKEAKEKEEETQRRKLKAMKAEADIEEAKRLAIKASQERCPHMARDISFVRGQRTGKNGRLFAICQICLKEYNSINEIPPHLQSDASFYGGPNY